MNFCPVCGSPLSPEGRFCTACGTPRATPPGPPVPPAPPVPSAPPIQPGVPPYGPLPPAAATVATAAATSRRGVTTLIASAVAVAAAAGVGAFVLLGGDGPGEQGAGRAAESSWAQYFVPARVGYACTSETIVDLGYATSEGTQTQRVTAVDNTDEGIRITLHTTGSVVVRSDGTTLATEPLDFELIYLIANDGTVAAPALNTSMSGMDMQTDGFVVYPSVEDLRAGRSREGTVNAALTPQDPSLRAQLQQMLAPGETALKMSMDFRVTGEASQTITTPAGEYSDVVGVTVAFTSIDVTNAAPDQQSDVDSVEAALAGLMPGATTWFARGVGPVQSDVTVMGFESSQKVTGCTG